MSGQDDADEARRRFQAPYTASHPIPTIQKYRQEKQARQDQTHSGGTEDEDGDDLAPSKTQQAKDAMRQYTRGGDDGDSTKDVAEQEEEELDSDSSEEQEPDLEENEGDGGMKDTSEMDPGSLDPKKKRKAMKKKNKKGGDERAERQVTDPVTHLPVTIHDFTSRALKDLPENDAAFGTTPRTSTGLSNKNKSDKQLQKEENELQDGHDATNMLFPDQDYDLLRLEMVRINKQGITIGLAGSVIIVLAAVLAERSVSVESLTGRNKAVSASVWALLGLLTVGAVWALIVGVRDWMTKKTSDIWDDRVWAVNFKKRQKEAKDHHNETVAWLNMLLASVWPLINPDLFTSLADTLEDVMQASLPKLVQMVSVDDIGQGSESLRILGIRWLPTGAASRSVGSDGKLESANAGKHSSDRMVPGEGEVDDSAQDKDDGKDDDKADQKQNDDQGDSGDGSSKQEVAEGMEAEEGDFVNLEVSFAYRARAHRKSLKDRVKNMHLYLAFYLPGNLKIPVWVDLRGVVGTMRLRLQLAPDPPFFALCTLSFMGQPKVDLSCTPLLKQAPNIMDLPLISNFVQSAVDAAMAEYVAPKSLTLDLKDMLAGDDFKKDTNARGVLVVHIHKGFDFRTGDPGIPLIKDGSSDPYVSVGWAKFGKPVWSTRLLVNEMSPCWEETAYILVTPEELNVAERLRVELWDSDRFSADDSLGRIELDLKQLMRSDDSNGKMHERTDGFRALEAGENMPGKLAWSVGYFSKARLQECQLQQQTYDPEVRSLDQLKEKVTHVCERKLREARVKGLLKLRDEDEMKQQEAQEMKTRQDAMIMSAPPPKDFPSGIFSIQIHQITGLELEKVNKSQVDKDPHRDAEEETGEDVPSSYCTVIINHQKVFKTRTKPKNAKPFFNAGTERFVPDWRNCDVFVSVRDARVKEDDALLGIVHLPLSEVFAERSQVSRQYPIMGGVGFGRVRLSMVWRSIQLQAPPKSLGWDYGTLEVKSDVTTTDLPSDLQNLKIKFRTDLGKGKMSPSKDDEGGSHVWKTTKSRSLKLAVKKRYGSCVAVQFQSKGTLRDKVSAFAVVWLRELVDDEQTEMTLPVWKGDYHRATTCCLEEYGEKVGSIRVKLAFWSGLGDAHSKWANSDQGMHEVTQVLDVARDNYESHENAKNAGIIDEDDTGSSDDGSDDSDDSDDDDHDHYNASQVSADGKVGGDDDGNVGESKQNIFDSARDYKKHMKQQHRRQRGLMQWKIPRTAQWAAHKVEHGQNKVADLFRHHSREPGIETEV